ncbi:MAG: cell division protein SepF [Bacillales bacterium]|jgi:cell division inhibitor SepF|nr:cell division protein SepF [Bacillales bacterium]
MAFIDNVKKFFAVDEEMEYEEEESVPETQQKSSRSEMPKPSMIRPVRQNVASIPNQGAARQSKMIVLEPTSYQDAKEIADHLINKRSVVVNMQRMNIDQTRRILDFVAGVLYPINGSMKTIGDQIYIFTPENVELAGSISNYEQHSEESNVRW